MKKILIVPLIFLALFLAISSAPQVHAVSGGSVCVNTTAATPAGCPATPASFTGPVGTKFVVAVNINNSAAINGFAISLHVDPTILKPLNATVDGSIVPTLPGTFFTANPANCVNNGVGFTVGTPGNIGCSGVDGNGTTTFAFLSVGGLSGAPTTGRLFTAAYQVVGTSGGTPIGYVMGSVCTGTSLLNTCVTITNGGTGGSVPEQLAETASFVNADPTSTAVACPPSINAGQTSTCTATVTDTKVPTSVPSGTVSFVSSNTAVGTVGASCILSATGSCSVSFTGVAAGMATVTGTYGGDATHAGSPGTSNIITVVVVRMDNTSTAVVCSPASISAGATSTCTATVTDTTTPPTVPAAPSGSVSFTSSNTAVGTVGASCTLAPSGTSTTVSTCSVSFTGVATGTATVTGVYGGDSTHFGSTSPPSNTISVVVPPAFIGGKLSWTHHLSLAKNAMAQSFTAKVTNFEAVPEYLQVFISSTGSTISGLSFQCPSANCTSPPTLFAAGASGTITITLVLPTTDIGTKFHFTANLEFSTALTSTGSLLNPQTSNSKSGAFAVVA